MYEVALVFLGMLVGTLPAWVARKRRLNTHWCALRAEIVQCGERAKSVFESDPLVLSPLYRLPLVTFQASLPVLLADGALAESESLVLGRFFSQAQDINRGLDNAAEMSKSDKGDKLKTEFDRNCLKAKRLVQARNTGKSLYDQAMDIVSRKISQKWWLYARHA